MVDQAEIHRNAVSGEVEERKEAADQLRDNFTDLPDKEEAWKDLHRLTEDEDMSVRWRAADAIGAAFPHIPDKEQAWEYLHRLARDESKGVRQWATESFGFAFPYFPDKEQAGEDLHRLTQDEDRFVRLGATIAIGAAFPHIPDKEQAWEDLHRLTQDEINSVRLNAAYSLGVAFPYFPDREQAGEDLHRLMQSEDSYVRQGVTESFGFAFPHFPDKEQAGEDLHRLMQSEDDGVRQCAAYALVDVFPRIPDKKQALEDLHQMVQGEDRGVRQSAAYVLGTTFPHSRNKKQACEDLIRLTHDKDVFVRCSAAKSLGIAFPHIPDKTQTREDLHRLTQDEDGDVRAFANHSLGKAYIFEVSEAESEENFRKELEKALEFFERSSKETDYFNPSSFCLPFYRSFYSITFEKEEAEVEVQKYLAEAKSASEGSENKEILLEAVENLANALTEVCKARETDFDTIKSKLNTYRRYCDHAADLIGAAEDETPGAARVLRRGLPIIDDRIKEIIREIQEKAGAVCRETRSTGTPYEPLGIEVNKWAGELSDRDYLQNERIASRIADILGEFCNLLPEDKREYPCKIVEELREESEPENKLIDIATVLSYLEPCIESQLQNAAKPTTDKTISDEQPSQKTGHITTVFAESGSTVVVPQTETESGDVTVNTAVTKESHPEEHRIDHQKRTAIEISADIAVHVLVYTVLHYFAEDLMPVIAPILVLSALIILLLIIRNAKSR